MTVGKFQHVNSKGSYLWQRYPEMQAGPPERVSLASLGVQAGDWIGLRCVGSYSAGTNYPYQTGLGGVFFGNNRELLPAAGGNSTPITTPATWPNNQPTDIGQDFFVARDQTTMVRVPAGATELRLAAPDSFYSDNGKDADFGCQITLPNRSTATPKFQRTKKATAAKVKSAVRRRGGKATLRDVEEYRAVHSVLAAYAKRVTYPTLQYATGSPFAAQPSTDTRPQYRGWYLRSGTTKGYWAPQWSAWRAARPSTTHWGWDLFAPRGAELVAPVGPCYIQFFSNVSGYGNIVAFRFTYRRKKYSGIYAHCNDFIGRDGREVAAGTPVAHAGCSGNASSEFCGADLDEGGRSDHVHVGLYEGTQIGDQYDPVDPATVLSWKPLTPA